MGSGVSRVVTLRKTVPVKQYPLTKSRLFEGYGVHRKAKSLYFEPVKRPIRTYTPMRRKPVCSHLGCAQPIPDVICPVRLHLTMNLLAAVSCLGLGMAVAAPVLAWEVGAGEAVVAQEPVIDTRAQRRANLRRALVEGSGRDSAGTQARPMSRDERDMLNRELREVMRSAYDEYTRPAQ